MCKSHKWSRLNDDEVFCKKCLEVREISKRVKWSYIDNPSITYPPVFPDPTVTTITYKEGNGLASPSVVGY